MAENFEHGWKESNKLRLLAFHVILNHVVGDSTASLRLGEQFPFIGGKGCICGVPSKDWCI